MQLYTDGLLLLHSECTKYRLALKNLDGHKLKDIAFEWHMTLADSSPQVAV